MVRFISGKLKFNSLKTEQAVPDTFFLVHFVFFNGSF